MKVPCQQCGAIIPRGDLFNHKKNHCQQLEQPTNKEETTHQISMSATNPKASTKEEQEFNGVFDILLRYSKSLQNNEKKISVQATCQLFDFSKSIFTDLRSTINNINYYFEKQPTASSIESTNFETHITQIQADSERCSVAIAGILFQLRAVRGLERRLVEKKAVDVAEANFGEPRVMQVTREMHEHLAKLACALKDESNKEKALATLADALEKHQREFCATINSLLD